MRILIQNVLKYIYSLIQRFIHKAKVKLLEHSIKKNKEIANDSVKKADKAYDDFASMLEQYERDSSGSKTDKDS